MRENIGYFIKQKKSIIGILVVPMLILLIPFVAMQFTGEVNWDRADFVIAWVIMASVGFAYRFAVGGVRKKGNSVFRAAVGVALAAAFILVWVNLAVGIIGSENNPANLMYFGVLAIGIIGSVIARLQPHKMAHALFATAFAQAMTALIALIAGMDKYPGSSVPQMLLVNGFFVVLFIASAGLFLRAARKHI